VDLPPLFAVTLPAFTYAVTGSSRHLFLERRSREREEEIRQGRVVQQRFLPEALIGQMLSHYHLTDTLGRGGMGVVYRGKDVNLGRPVAIKVLPGGVLADPNARQRFRREARVLSRLTHPHTARLYDFDSQDGLDFLVLEFIEGRTLAERLRQGPLPEPEILRLGAQIADALAEAHAKGVVHRDLKPANVMLTPQGEAKILDFGLGRVFQDATTSTATHVLTEEGVTVGTVPYMAPETLRGEAADPRTDIYGLGMILYEVATGRRPFPNDAPHELLHTILHQEPPEPRVLNRRISPGLERIILKALEKDPDRRQQSSLEFLNELNALNRSESRT
jgi:eukaryotic-like serine/threonine-protein kinase